MKGSIFNRLVPAKALEEAVVDLVANMLMNDEQLRDRLIKFIEEETQKATPTEELTDLQERRGQIKRRTEFIVASLDEETLADAQKELDRLKNERRSLDERIAAFEASARCGR